MPSSISPDPLAYVHPADQCVRNVFYSDKHVDHRLNIYYNSTRVVGGNPLLVIVHGGSWNANEKTGFVEAGGSGAPTGAFWFAYFLDSTSYGTTAHFDVVALEYSCHTHDGSTTTYEPYVSANGAVNVLAIGYPTYGKVPDDIQRALQYLDGLADRAPECPAAVTNGWIGPRWNRDKKIIAAHSVGACSSMVAALRPSRPWNPHAAGEYQARYEAKVRGVINWEGEVNLDPWFMYYRHAKHLLGKVQFSGPLMIADVNREFLEPSASGAFPQGQPKTQRCKEFSPVDAIAMYHSYKPDLRIRSYYWKNLGPGGALAETEEINMIDYGTTYSPGYAAVPPYDASGHDYRQFAILAATCATYGIDHSGQVIDGLTIGSGDGVHGSVPGLDARTEAWESTLALTYAWAVETIADD